MKEFKLLTASTAELLTKEVNEFLGDGWVLSGIHQVTVTLFTGIPNHPLDGTFVSLYSQAITRS